VGARILPLHRVVSRLGRSSPAATITPDLDLGPEDTERRVSRRHAEVTCRPGVTELTDLRSANGTYRNGVLLEPGRPCVLRDGDRLTFGDVPAVYVADVPWPEGLVAEWAAQEPASAVPQDPTMTLFGHRGAVLHEAAQAPAPKRRLLPDSLRIWRKR
jgi:predicted component of type VI protein secretion system